MHAHPIAEDAGEIKAQRKKSTAPIRDSDLWYERYPRRFRESTSTMPFDLRAAYGILVDLYFEHGAALPNDDKWIACGLYIDVRKWMHIRRQLFALKKLALGKDGLIHNAFADELLAKRRAMIAAEQRASALRARGGEEATPASTSPSTPASTSGGTEGDFSENGNEINGGDVHSNSNIDIDKVGVCGEVENNSSVIYLAEAAAARIDHADLKAKLYEAAGDAIANPAGAPNLLNLSTAVWWIEHGCLLERDVLPTIRHICSRRRRGGRIVSWDYFTEAITAAKKKREQPLPDVDVSQAPVRHKSARVEAAERAMQIAKQRAAMGASA